jgi:Big-like domain-containing protein
MKRKLQLAGSFAILFLSAMGLGCKGFFVNSPDSLSISPDSASLNVGQSQNLQALAVYGTTSKDVTSTATWTTTSPCIVSVSTTTLGEVTAVGTGGAATITATYNGAIATATITSPSGVVISPCGNFNNGTTQVFSANLSGQDVTSTTTWTSSDTNIVNFPNAANSQASFGPNTGTAIITATTSSATGSLQVTVQ